MLKVSTKSAVESARESFGQRYAESPNPKRRRATGLRNQVGPDARLAQGSIRRPFLSTCCYLTPRANHCVEHHRRGWRDRVSLSRALSSEHELSVVDLDPDVAERFDGFDVRSLIGSSTSLADLEQAEIGACDRFISCTGLDEVKGCLCARQGVRGD